MELCLSHPEHGYYQSGNPFGAAGDFTTAPEISQMFGELLGLWLVQMWQDLGAPEAFSLVELGPGRGTLMADILRVAKAQPDFLAGAKVFLLESSEKLRQQQQAALGGHAITFLQQLDDLPEAPVLLVANEFFDALPIRQFVRNDFGWQEKLISPGLRETLGKTIQAPDLDRRFPDIATGNVVEINETTEAFADVITKLVKANSGAALIIDYGDMHGYGDTLQAISSHRFTDPLEAPGAADLTAHVRFSDLVHDDIEFAFTTQGEFLRHLGINARKDALEASSGRSFNAEMNRLIDDAEMGRLFKVLALSSEALTTAPGFSK